MRVAWVTTAALLAAIIASLVLPARPALGATFTVSTTADTNDGICDADCSLREAIVAANAAGGADTITLPAGTYMLTTAGAGENAAATGDLDISGDLTINGAGAATTIIDGGTLDRVFHVPGASSVSISGTTVYNGTEAFGGGIYNEGGGTLTLNNSTVSWNSASGSGGGIYNSGGTLTLNSSAVNNNSASNGGGIYTSGGGTLTLNGSTVSSNFASSSGGAIYDSFFTVATLTSTTISGNSAFNGSGIYNSNSDATLNNSTVSFNEASTSGGGILNQQSSFFTSTVTLNGSTVTINAASDGGGIYNSGGSANATLNSSTVSGNTATNGGGIYNAFGGATLTISTVSNNLAFNSGGGMYNNGGGLTLTSSTASNNSADDGGGMYNNGGGLTLTSSSVSNNSASNRGGGIYHGGGGSATLTGSIVNNNSAFQGGGIRIASFTALTLSGSTVSNNLALDDGGGIDNRSGTLTLTSSTVSNNLASNEGGGIDNGGFVTLNSGTVAYNAATLGSGIYNPGGIVNIKNTIVANNNPLGGNCGGNSVISNGFNLSSDNLCLFTSLGDMTMTDPKLGPLAFNGGLTPTHALLNGSPAVDAGIIPCPPPATDQRGVSRPQGLRCDIGAYEADDSDGDGVADPLDPDDDNDGFLDAIDPCRTQPEDFDGYQDTDGCPDPDNDLDGICDAGQTSVSCSGSDTGKACFDPAVTLSCPTTDCRNVAEDIDAFHDGDGCPEPDNDNDGHPDVGDLCPGTDSQTGADGMLGSPQDLNHNGIQNSGESPLTTDDVVPYVFEDWDGVLDADGCHDSPGDDFDGDSFSDDAEALFLGTDAGRACPRTAIDNDEDPDPWPFDFNDNQTVELTDLLGAGQSFKKSFGAVDPDPKYFRRFDLNMDGTIGILDLLGFPNSFKTKFGSSCTP